MAKSTLTGKKLHPILGFGGGRGGGGGGRGGYWNKEDDRSYPRNDFRDRNDDRGNNRWSDSSRGGGGWNNGGGGYGNNRWQDQGDNDRWKGGKDRRGGGGGGAPPPGQNDDWTVPLARNERVEAELFGGGHGNSGINFDRYEDIPVEATGSDVPKGIEDVRIETQFV